MSQTKPDRSQLRDIDEADLDSLLALNNAHALETSLLTRVRLARMIGEAFSARTTDHATALLIAFDQSADYDSPNFLWFRERYRTFVYVDRIVVGAALRGQGIARRLYEDLFVQAGERDHDLVCCEVNREPPNPASDAFHAARGFVELGRAQVGAGKEVRYLVKAMP